MKTEKWTFGIAMYFCFIAFTTIGYGDLSPVTPAGRSVFIVWALLGVGAMTILISIISEAYSNRYQHIIRSGVFDHVVKRYRDQIHRASIQPKPTQLSGHLEPVPLSTAATLTPSHEALTTKTKQELSDELEETRRRTDEKLVALPHEILSQAREFHDDISYFLKPVHALPPLADQGLESDHKGPETSSRDADRVEDEAASPDNQEESQLEEERSKGRIGRRLVSRLSGRKTRQEKMKERNEGIQKGESARPIPESLDRLLNEITGVEGLSKRAKEEILEDDDARHTLLALSIQEALGRLIIVAEDALQSLAERDALMKLQERERETKETAQGQNGGEQ
ncbi:hypothetical protein AX16_008363 [Volvariella volvacea WC 439]|nr:hypothetical protein AX16_008363 [Volvariella volvacea WC 439]